ncbi:MAG: protein kinase [Terriglobales bacterium]|jgi:serine/threonine-protein kinase
MSEEPIQRIGDYEILSVLGTGGMGKVFKVRNVISDRIEAMKVLRQDLVGRQELDNRFLREIKLLASLDHPNIAVLRTALMLDNRLVMIIEYVEGSSLAARLEQGPIPPAQAVDYISQALAGLGYAHKQHVVHRDMKPANMMVTPQGVLKIMDFGIAHGANDAALTKTGTTLGSLYYMSPEQVAGQPTDERSDLYSVGVSLYEMVTGQRPFTADSDFSIMAAQLQNAPRPPLELCANLPEGLNEIILLAMAKDPAQRFQSADAFKAALSSVQSGVTAAPQTSAQPVAAAPMPVTAQTSRGVSATAGFGTTPYVPSSASSTAAAVAAQRPPTQNIPLPVPARPQHRGLYITLGAVIVLSALVAAGFVGLRHTAAKEGTPSAQPSAASQTENAAGVPATPAPATDNTSGTNAEAGATNPSTPSGTGADASVPVQPVASPAPANSSATEVQPPAGKSLGVKRAPSPVANTTAVNPPPAPPSGQVSAGAPPSVDNSQLEELQQQHDQLSGRAAAIDSSLNRLQQSQAAQGLGLRGDIAAAQARMHSNLDRANAALQSGDAAHAKKSLEQADAAAEQLEKFLGH